MADQQHELYSTAHMKHSDGGRATSAVWPAQKKPTPTATHQTTAHHHGSRHSTCDNYVLRGGNTSLNRTERPGSQQHRNPCNATQRAPWKTATCTDVGVLFRCCGKDASCSLVHPFSTTFLNVCLSSVVRQSCVSRVREHLYFMFHRSKKRSLQLYGLDVPIIGGGGGGIVPCNIYYKLARHDPAIHVYVGSPSTLALYTPRPAPIVRTSTAHVCSLCVHAVALLGSYLHRRDACSPLCSCCRAQCATRN